MSCKISTFYCEPCFSFCLPFNFVSVQLVQRLDPRSLAQFGDASWIIALHSFRARPRDTWFLHLERDSHDPHPSFLSSCSISHCDSVPIHADDNNSKYPLSLPSNRRTAATPALLRPTQAQPSRWLTRWAGQPDDLEGAPLGREYVPSGWDSERPLCSQLPARGWKGLQEILPKYWPPENMTRGNA